MARVVKKVVRGTVVAGVLVDDRVELDWVMVWARVVKRVVRAVVEVLCCVAT